MKEINIAGIVLILFFILFIIGKRKKHYKDYLLIVINLLGVLYLTTDMYVRLFSSSMVFILNVMVQFYLLPVYYAYTEQLLQVKKLTAWRKWLYILWPASFTVFIILDHFILNSYDEGLLKSLYERPPLIYKFFYFGNVVVIIVFLALQRIKLNQFEVRLKEQFSRIESINQSWILTINCAYLFIVLSSFLFFHLFQIGIFTSLSPATSTINVILATVIGYTSYKGIKQYATDEFSIEKQNIEYQIRGITVKNDKYKTSSLKKEDIDKIHERLIALFENEKPFLNPEISIQLLASSLGVSVHALSQSINSIEKNSFYDFVNRYRVNQLKKNLTDPKNARFTILALGFNCGFSSKASMNRVFRNFEGMSPSRYKKQYSKVLSS